MIKIRADTFFSLRNISHDLRDVFAASFQLFLPHVEHFATYKWISREQCEGTYKAHFKQGFSDP